MFTRLTVENFLSLKSVSLELGKVNVLIGPNASGKSNVARAFQLVANHARGGLPLLEGYESLVDLSFAFNPVINARVELEALVNGRRYKYALELKADKYVERILADNEEVLTHDSTSGAVYIRGGKEVHPGISRDFCSYYRGSIYASALTALPSEVEPGIHALASKLRGITVHSFAPSHLRLKGPVSQKPPLKYHGENFARYLLYLYLERRRDFEYVEEALRSTVPEVEEIVPHIEGADVEVWIKAKGLSEPLKPSNISDGTLRIMAMASVLYGGFSLVVLEEPENCVHPRLLGALMDLARGAPSQVVMTTHSPYLLDHARPEEVYVVEKEGLETKVKKLSTAKELEAVKRFLEEGGTLGEAWYSGLIGGTP